MTMHGQFHVDDFDGTVAMALDPGQSSGPQAHLLAVCSGAV